jgi:hypothetical protein
MHKKIKEKEMAVLTWGQKFVRIVFDLVISFWKQRKPGRTSITEST